MNPFFSPKTLLAILAITVSTGAAGAAYCWRLPPAELFAPIEATITDAQSSHRSYCIRNYGILEIGNVRMAFRGYRFDVESSGLFKVAADGSSVPEDGYQSGVFSHAETPNGSGCWFGDTMGFDVERKEITWAGHSFPIDGPPKLLIFGTQRQKWSHPLPIESVVDL